MKNERMFLITKEIDNQTVVLGYVTHRWYPSTIANDHEKQKELFGYTGVRVHEITERCHVKVSDRRYKLC